MYNNLQIPKMLWLPEMMWVLSTWPLLALRYSMIISGYLRWCDYLKCKYSWPDPWPLSALWWTIIILRYPKYCTFLRFNYMYSWFYLCRYWDVPWLSWNIWDAELTWDARGGWSSCWGRSWCGCLHKLCWWRSSPSPHRC